MRDCAVVVIQMQAVSSAEDSLARALALTRQALSFAPDLVVLPENYAGFLAPENRQRDAFDSQNPAAGIAIAPFVALSRSSDALLVLGGTPERRTATSAPFNTAVAVQGGRVVGRYRKVHLFDLKLPGTTLHEAAYTSPGREPVLLATPVARIGLSICYDLRFPAFYRALVQAGAELILVPSAFTLRTGMDHWEVLLRARAIETQCYVLAPAQWGEHGSGRESYGHSMIVDPWGTVIAQASAGDGLLCADLRADVLERARAQLPAMQRSSAVPETSVVEVPFVIGGKLA